jgi:glycosyltransferase involved in cell wall biosynthesis
MKKKHNVLLILEGTYPYNGGGVSTWAHILCNEIKNANFSLYSINASYEATPKYILSDNVRHVIQVPQWAPLEPKELIDYGKKYYKLVYKKNYNDEKIIDDEFIPLFASFLKNIKGHDSNTVELDAIIYKMWQFFQNHDYKKTMQSQKVWQTFYEISKEDLISEKDNETTLFDITEGLRWIYRFLIPITIKVPKCDISHITLAGFPILPALVLKYKYGTPIIVTEHGVFIRERLLAINAAEYSFFLKKLLIRFSEAITKLVYYKADLILSVNKFNITWEKLYGADTDKIKVIYNGIDHLLFSPKPKPNHLKDIPTVVAAARIFDLKDVITMIKSCHVVKEQIPNVRYIVYGDDNAVPEYTAECNRLIKALNLQDNFVFGGINRNPNLLYCEGDISILTSISEGFPYTVIESMSCGIPVVATDVGGVSEALDENCGFICKPKDFKEIGNRVIELLQDKDLRIKKGLNARQKVIDYFTIGTFISEYEKAYESVLKINQQ